MSPASKVCGEEQFFNLTEFLSSATPHFSECFQQVVLQLTPCFIHWIFALPVYLKRRKSAHAEILPSRLFRLRMFVTILMKLLSVVDVCYATYEYINGDNPPLAHIFSPGLVGFTMVHVIFSLKFDRKKGIKTSGHHSTLWAFCLIFWGVIFFEKFQLMFANDTISNGDLLRSAIFVIKYVCAFSHFLMCFAVDGPRSGLSKDKYLKEDETNGYLSRSGAKLCPEKSSCFYSRATFHWFTRMVYKGYKQPIVEDDLWILNDTEKSGRSARHFLKNWNAERRLCKCNPESNFEESPLKAPAATDVLIQDPGTNTVKEASLFRALRNTFGPVFISSVFLKILNDALQFISPQLLSLLIGFNEGNSPVWQGYFLAVMMLLVACVKSVVINQYFHVCFLTGMRLRSAVISAVYRKALVLSNSARKDSTAGEIVNLMSVDAQRLQDLLPYINTLWSGPFQIVIALVFLHNELGNSVFAGLAVMVTLIPINGVIAKKAYKSQTGQMKHKDERIKMMNEILNGIKLLKMYAWEMSFMEKVNVIRGKETKKLKTASYLMAVASLTWGLAPFLVSLVTFAVYVLSDESHVLDAKKAFVSLALFELLRFPIIMIPMMISSVIDAKVSLTRLQNFLCQSELNPQNVQRAATNENVFTSDDKPVISVDNAKFTWDKNDAAVLNDINISIKEGELVAIVGQVGCGKSSLVQALLGDMEKVEGNVKVKGTCAYVPQQAWIQNMTVRDNILFNKQFSCVLYEQAVTSCQLQQDFKMLQNGDLTEIGERGINLSGGQKQRISIARAVYQYRDIYLFDDPLSAVDAHVGKNIFDQVIGPNGALKTKTRLLVTHGVSFLPQVDRIIVMVDGRITEVGSYDELIRNNGHFGEFLKTYNETKEESGGENEEDKEEAPKRTRPSQSSFRNRRKSRRFSRSQSVSKFCEQIEKSKEDKKSADKLMSEETMETGSIKFGDVLLYLKALGGPFFVLFLINLTLQNAASIGSGLWLSAWSNDPVDPITGTQNSTMYRLEVYGLFGLGQALFLFIGSILLTWSSVRAAVKIHNKMLLTIIRSPMSFFDTTPLGRIINRFSKDVYLIDEVIPSNLKSFLSTMFSVLSTIFVISYSFPIFLAAIVPILVVYYAVQRIFVKTSRQLKRLESVRRSPIYSHFSESLNGLLQFACFNVCTN